MNLEDICINCGKSHVSWYDVFELREFNLWYGRDKAEPKMCCDNPKKATKADIINKILGEI